MRVVTRSKDFVADLKGASEMSLPELLPAIRPVLEAFDHLGIGYYVGGSVASSIYGETRSSFCNSSTCHRDEQFVRHKQQGSHQNRKLWHDFESS